MLNVSAAANHGLDIVTSCLGCSTPANFGATAALIAIGVLMTWLRERRAADGSARALGSRGNAA